MVIRMCDKDTALEGGGFTGPSGRMSGKRMVYITVEMLKVTEGPGASDSSVKV